MKTRLTSERKQSCLSLFLTLSFALCFWQLPAHAAAQKKFLIGFSQSNFAEPWRQSMNQEVLEEARKYPEIEVKISDAAQDNSKQVADVENFIRQRVDVLMISPNEAQPLTSVVKKAYQAGIPVIVIDRKIVGDTYTSFIGADNRAIGRAAGEFAVKLLGGKGKIVELKGLPGSTPAMERGAGFHEVVDKAKGIEVVHSATGDWLRDKGRTQMEMALQAHDHIDLVYAHNDPMAMGAWLAAKAVSRQDEMKFLGIDALQGADGGIKMVVDGKLAATFAYPSGGREAVDLALKAAKKEPLPKTVTLNTFTVSSANAKKLYRTM